MRGDILKGCCGEEPLSTGLSLLRAATIKQIPAALLPAELRCVFIILFPSSGSGALGLSLARVLSLNFLTIL